MKATPATTNKLHKDKKSYNTKVYELVCKRLNLKRREKIILFKFLGFLLRNDKPFPYTISKLEINSGYKKSSIFESINLLEKDQIIERVGFSSRVRYTKGIKLVKYCTLVQNRINNSLINNYTPLQKMDRIVPATPETGYQKTSSSLKHKEYNYKPSTPNPKPTPTPTPTPTPKPNPKNRPTVMDFQEYAHNVKGYEWVGEYLKKLS